MSTAWTLDPGGEVLLAGSREGSVHGALRSEPLHGMMQTTLCGGWTQPFGKSICDSTRD